MRVLHIYAGNLFGGIETLLVTLARQRSLCPEMKPEFALCFEGRLSKELVQAGAVVHYLGGVRLRWPWTVMRARWRLNRLLQRGGYDAAITHGCWPHALAAPSARQTSTRLVFWLHDFPDRRHSIERWAARHRPDFVVANSRATLAALPALFPAVPSAVAHLPVSPPPMMDRTVVRRDTRSELATPADAVVVVTACRLEEWKGHVCLLQALGELRNLPVWELWIVGGPQRPHEKRYLENLKEQAARLGIGNRVRFLGLRSDVIRFMGAADIYCQPNTRPEPFGIAFVEALYAGLPVVTTAHGGALEIVDDDCGLLIPPGDVSLLAKALAAVVTDDRLRSRLAARGPARARELCDPKPRLAELFGHLSGIASFKRARFGRARVMPT
jgi:glycosyltransferase involved in cell wall biosynthesis